MEKNNISTKLYDVIRIVATFLVVIGHSGYIAWQGDSGSISLELENAVPLYYELSEKINIAMQWIYGFHMQLFFMLSGALYKYSKNITSFDNLIKSKLKRLIVPFYLVGVCYMLPVKYITGFYTKETYGNVLSGYLIGGNSGHLWFLISLFWCFVIFYPIEKYVGKYSKYAILIIACILYFAYEGGWFYTSLSYVPGLDRALANLPYFIFGYLIEECRKSYQMKSHAKIIITIVVGIMSCVQYINKFLTVNLSIALLGAMFIYSMGGMLTIKEEWLNTRLFKLLKRNSFYIYLFHEPINFVMLRLANDKNLIATDAGTVIFFMGRTIGAILISIMFGEIIGKIIQFGSFNFVQKRRPNCQ